MKRLTYKAFFYIFFLISCLMVSKTWAQTGKVSIGVAGMTHGHVGWIYGKMDHSIYEFVGFAEPDEELAAKLFKEHNIPSSLWYPSLEKMIQEVEMDGVVAFGSIYEHLEVVQLCAPAGINVMVEKPLAVNMEHATQMANLAEKNGILLLTNYETSWWSSTLQMIKNAQDNELGEIRKVVVHDGHMGPKEIQVSPEFLKWLTDPKLNGGGAVIDFGCYGANLSTAIMKNQRPISITAVLQQLQPDSYPLVDDEATIVLSYDKSQTIIQASWNWPYHRKDMEVYGTVSCEFQQNPNTIKRRTGNNFEDIVLEDAVAPDNDPFIYFSQAIRGTITIAPTNLYSLENNLIVMEILDAAVKSAKSGSTIFLESVEE